MKVYDYETNATYTSIAAWTEADGNIILDFAVPGRDVRIILDTKEEQRLFRKTIREDVKA